MMAIMKRFDVTVKGDSSYTKEEAIQFCTDKANELQEKSSNVNSDGSYDAYYYVDLFDSRDASMLRVLSSASLVAFNATQVFTLYEKAEQTESVQAEILQ